MEFLKQWAITICFAAAAGGIATLLLPQSNPLNKLFRMVVALFFLCGIILPVTSGAAVFSSYNREKQQEEVGQMAEQIEKSTDEFAYFLAKENINKLIQEKLTSLNIYPEEVVVYFQEEDGKIKSIHAEIYGDSALQGREQELADLIKRELGIEAICYFGTVK